MRLCSQALCRQVAEHHFGIGPRLRGMIGPPHQPRIVAAVCRSGPSRRWGGPVRTGVFHPGVLALLAVLLLARPPSGPVLRGAAGSYVLSLLAILL